MTDRDVASAQLARTGTTWTSTAQPLQDPSMMLRTTIALLATLYGVLLARLVFQPAADKTLQREQIVRYRNYLMMEGFVMLAEERPARYIETRINSMIDPNLLATMAPPKATKSGDAA